LLSVLHHWLKLVTGFSSGPNAWYHTALGRRWELAFCNATRHNYNLCTF